MVAAPLDHEQSIATTDGLQILQTPVPKFSFECLSFLFGKGIRTPKFVSDLENCGDSSVPRMCKPYQRPSPVDKVLSLDMEQRTVPCLSMFHGEDSSMFLSWSLLFSKVKLLQCLVKLPKFKSGSVRERTLQ